MKKIVFSVLLCCLAFLLAGSALAQEQSLPVMMITYPADVLLSREEAVEAQVVLVQDGQESTFSVSLRLNDESLDYVEKLLPQKSLRVESDDLCFVLDNGGNDACLTNIVSYVCGSLVAQGPIDIAMRAEEPVEVYLNGQYWGIYSRCEDMVDAIVRFEGLEDASALRVTNVNEDAIWGDVSGFAKDLGRIKALNLSREEDRQTLGELLDTDSFLNWYAVNSYLGTGFVFTGIIYYQIGDGSWKCAMGDTAYSLMSASANTFIRLGDDRSPQFDACIIANMMLEQPEYRDAFLTKLGALYQALPVSAMQEIVDEQSVRIASAMPEHKSRWAYEFHQVLADDPRASSADTQEALLFQQYRVYRLRDKILVQRPWHVYDTVQRELNVSDEDMARYFGGVKPELPDVPGDMWTEYKEANQKN